YENEVAFGKVNILKNQTTAEEYSVRSVPTIMIFKWGKRKKTIVGKRSMADIRKSLEDVL
ncbi:MAG: thioredoxin domain-containing protein, partial [Thermoplasmata archaeon]